MKRLTGLIFALFFTVSYSQQLIIGTTADNPPFASLADSKSNFYGFEIDIMMELCTRIQAQCQFQQAIVTDIPSLLYDNKINLAIATLITPMPSSTGLDEFVFSAPYMLSSAQFLVRNDSVIQNLEDIRYKTVGVRLGPFMGGMLIKDYIWFMYNKQLSTALYTTMTELIDALKNKDINAIFTNTQAIDFWYTNNKDQFRLIGDPFFVGNGYVIAAKKGGEALITQINQALYAIEQDGTYMTIYNRYFSLE